MGIDAILLETVFDWNFIINSIERDDGRTINDGDETSQELSKQAVAQEQVIPEVYY